MSLKYYVYVLKKDEDLLYIGSTRKIIERIKTHKRDKDFNRAYYCEAKTKDEMLSIESELITIHKPPLNKNSPNKIVDFDYNEVKFKRMDLTFLLSDTVDMFRDIEYGCWWDYNKYVCDKLGIRGVNPYDEDYFTFDYVNGKVVAYFDGSGSKLKEFAVKMGLVCYEKFLNYTYNKAGKIPLENYERSLVQFD